MAMELVLMIGIIVLILASIDKKRRKNQWKEFIEGCNRYKGL